MDVEVAISVSMLDCNIKTPPVKGAALQQQILQNIKSSLGEQDIHLREGNYGPTVVTVVNSSRTNADIRRDVRAANLTDTEAENVIILRLVPTNDQNKDVGKVNLKEMNIKLDLSFLIDPDTPTVYQCEHNSNQLEEAV